MISKPHRNNSDFQLRYFLAGSCHTPDGAWMLMFQHKTDIENKIKHTEAQAIRRNAARAKAVAALADLFLSPYDRAMNEADIIETDAGAPIAELNLQAARAELLTIEAIMAEIEPSRKYGHLSPLEANEAAQREEWLGELKRRAENFIITQGTIPHDHFETMRQHPDFETKIVPHIHKVHNTYRVKALVEQSYDTQQINRGFRQ